MTGSTGQRSALGTVLEMIRFEHTLFALPFALMGMMLAARGWPEWRTVGWIVVAMVAARSAAMGFNRLADHQIDAANPRTAERALPTGRVSRPFVTLFVAASVLLFLLAAWRLSPLCLALAPLAVMILLGYSYSKRFTALSHLWLGLALAGAPIGAWIAVRGSVEPPAFALAGAVLLWVAGFDVLYSLQDIQIDRARGLRSIPALLGEIPALVISVMMHLGTLALLAWLPRLYPPGLDGLYWAGWVACLLLVAWQHWIVRPGDLSRLDAAFFTANGVLSMVLFLLTGADLLLLR